MGLGSGNFGHCRHFKYHGGTSNYAMLNRRFLKVRMEAGYALVPFSNFNVEDRDKDDNEHSKIKKKLNGF